MERGQIKLTVVCCQPECGNEIEVLETTREKAMSMLETWGDMMVGSTICNRCLFGLMKAPDGEVSCG